MKTFVNFPCARGDAAFRLGFQEKGKERGGGLEAGRKQRVKGRERKGVRVGGRGKRETERGV